MLEQEEQQRKSRKLDELSEDSFDFFVSRRLSLSLSSRSEGSLYNTKQKKVQLYAQATLNVQHQAIHPYTPFSQRTSCRANFNQSNKSRPPMSWYRHPIKLFAIFRRSTVPQFYRCSIQHFLQCFQARTLLFIPKISSFFTHGDLHP